MIKQNRLFEYSYRYRGGKTERKSDREKNDESYRRVRKGDRERVSSIIRLFTSETGCKCYSICLMESLSLLSFLPSSSRVPPRIGIPPNFLPPFLFSAALPPPLLSLSLTLCTFFPLSLTFLLLSRRELFLLSRNALRPAISDVVVSSTRRSSLFRESLGRYPRITRKRGEEIDVDGTS